MAPLERLLAEIDVMRLERRYNRRDEGVALDPGVQLAPRRMRADELGIRLAIGFLGQRILVPDLWQIREQLPGRIAVDELAVQVVGERRLGDADREGLIAELEMVVREHFGLL